MAPPPGRRRVPRSDGIDRAAGAGSSRPRSRRRATAGSHPSRRASCCSGLRRPVVPELVATDDEARRGCAHARLPRRREVGRGGRAQDRARRRRTRPPGRAGRSARPSADRHAGARPAALTGGVELLAGAVQDPVFGPLVAFGPGGVLAELIGEARSGSRPSPTSTPRSSSSPARPDGSSAGSAARRPPTPAPSSTSCTASAAWPRASGGRRARPQPRGRLAKRLRGGRRARAGRDTPARASAQGLVAPARAVSVSTPAALRACAEAGRYTRR